MLRNGGRIVYKIITIDGMSVLNNYSIIKEKGQKICFFDINVGNDRSVSIKRHVDEYGDCGLIYQLVDEIKKQNEYDELIESDNMFNQIVFLDFHDLFSKDTKDIKEYMEKNRKRVSAEEYESEQGKISRFRDLMRGDGNFKISFKNSKEYVYVPFDKSNSMARECKISFIRKDYWKAMDERLMLGMDFSKTPVELSKYYAYRGLYFSTGYRINRNDKLLMSQDTVIVINDIKTETDNEINVFTAKQRSMDREYWDYVEEKKKVEVNWFDGEGLISPEYCTYINEILENEYNINKMSNSFQIRMPFVKGMLHTVDFRRFLLEELKIEDIENSYIEDIFGVKRSLKNVQIILTKSMFKMHKWVKGIYADTKELIMEEYFERFNRYDHAMYITNMESRLKNHGFISLNYQFLSTLKISKEDMRLLVDRYMDGLGKLEDKFAEEGYDLLEKYEDEFCNDTESPDDVLCKTDEEEISADERESIWEKCKMAVAKRRAFLKTGMVASIIKSEQMAYKKKIGAGQIPVTGKQCFLSGDLLAFLIKLGENVISDKCDKNIECCTKKTLRENELYMPLKENADEERLYGLLRNPHLSRNEQCVLKPLSIKNSIYDNYFSHLKSVVMVSHKSLAPMILGGADFDGDLVKVIDDKCVVDAIISGVYEKRDNNLKRKLPVVEIPSGQTNSRYISNKIDFETIMNTFSNSVGQISNMAIEFATKRYFTNFDENNSEIDYCSACTIVTGLEIDAAKSGKHPTENIKELEKVLDREGWSYIKYKVFLQNEIKKGKKKYNQFGSIKNEEKKEMTLKYGNCSHTFPIYTWEDDVANIERLPYICSEALSNNTRPDHSSIKKDKFFAFQEIKDFKKIFEKEKEEKIRELVVSYSKIRGLIWKIRKKGITDGYLGYIITILRWQYGSEREVMASGIRVDDILVCAKNEIMNIVTENVDTKFALRNIEKALHEIRNIPWQYVKESERKRVGNEIVNILNANSTILLPDAVIQLISEFRKSGYLIMYYLIRDVQKDLMESVEYAAEEELEKEEQLIDRNIYESDFFKYMYGIFTNMADKCYSLSIINEKLIAYSRKKIGESFDKIEDAIPYVWTMYKEDSNKKFFWNVFTSKEIIKAIEGDISYVE